jgi:hypothetical protein
LNERGFGFLRRYQNILPEGDDATKFRVREAEIDFP